MTGDQPDMQQRMRAVLPVGWFPDVAPVLDSLTSALAWSWAWAYSLLSYVKAQTRLATASGVWLDIIALDFFGDAVARQPEESDDSLRSRISTALNRERGTRAAVVSAVLDATGQAPAIFEPARTQDTGGWGGAGGAAFAYGAAGGWGSLALPFQLFVTAYRPQGADSSNDAAIYAAVAGVLPAGVTAWTQITDRGS